MREIGPVKKIKELRPELGAVPFLELPSLRHRKVDVIIVWATEDVAVRVTQSSIGGRSQNATA